jgi:hypothetical protein
MTRQINQNNIKRVLNAKEAREYLGLSRYNFEKAVREGSIKFKLIGTKKFFPTWVLEEWQNDTMNHTDFSKGAKHITPISHSYPPQASEYSLGKVVAQWKSRMQSNTASKGLQNYRNKLNNKQAVNCPA